MKTFVLIFILFINSLVAKEISPKLLMYKANGSSLDIQKHSSKFYEIEKDEHFDDKNSTYWLQMKLGNSLEDGKYILSYAGFEIDFYTFNEMQLVKKFSLGGLKNFEFFYEKIRDEEVYYLQILPNALSYNGIYLVIQSDETYIENIDKAMIMRVLIGLVVGIIFMAIVYNLGIFYFNRQKVFLYYSLMQFFIILLLLFSSSSMFLLLVEKLMNWGKLELIDLFATLFFILFSREFLDTPKFTPKLDKILLFYLFVLFIDIVITIFYKSIILIDVPYSPFLLLLIFISVTRLLQGFKPASFYLIGWGIMLVSIAFMEFFGENLQFNPMLIGSAAEAILLSLAISYKFKLLLLENEQQTQMMIQQSKLASMGEMLGNIAHQWRQPLTRLSYIFMNIDELDEKKLRSKKIEDGIKQLEFMSETIDDFKDFYTPDKQKEYFSIAKETQKVFDLMRFEDIEMAIKITEDAELYNYKREYRQVLLNLLSNAKEAFDERDIQNKTITISINKNTLQIIDNAGGIKESEFEKIFEPYYSTKEQSLGIGLYMSKVIIEKNMKGDLSVENRDSGAVFTILLPLV